MSIKIKSIWDNEGSTMDQYTVVTNMTDSLHGYPLCLSVSTNPHSPQGISMFGYCKEGPHLGKEINMDDLSSEVRIHIRERLE